ncbi:PEGA domain-containing protein [Pseudorhodoplanes sp.]|uniref:PEGA domain-containing protein n=1 Tax=Pseudorhodoplanes sp. TaxID=1934341 RepID=UPI002B554A8D|nr:PEGA domain-containing protein [Pseudorhodoplanes sp.]HWM81116.1 PEGA domain-containing protein [Pseudolabrys sp.]HWV51796.1 PEGA domain-containing protein [Pseudorhodoplanes sp.]
MYRVIAIIGGSLLLAACSSSNSDFDFFKPAPVTDAVRFESEPPGAEVKVGDQTCKTPCSLALQTTEGQTATFTLEGYQTATENLQVITGNGPPTLRPNPATVELEAAPPQPTAKRRRAAPKKPAPKPRAAAPAATPQAAAPAPAAPAPAPAASSPWPSAPPPAASQQ